MKKILFVDTGLNLQHALSLSNYFEVYYNIQYYSPYPKSFYTVIGEGFSEIYPNFKKVDNLFNLLKEVDYVMFADVGFGDLIDYLRKRGFNVFGAGIDIEKLEFDRINFYEVCNSLGIKTPSYEVIKGFDNLVKYFKFKKQPHYVKINKFRGNIETFFAKNIDNIYSTLSNSNLGILLKDFVFIVQKELRGIEIGADAFFDGDKFIKPYLFTIGLLENGMIGRWVNSSVLDDFFEKITPFLKSHNFKGVFGIEGFFDGKDFYATDPAPRFSLPTSLIFTKTLKNYGEVIENVFNKKSALFNISQFYNCILCFYGEKLNEW